MRNRSGMGHRLAFWMIFVLAVVGVCRWRIQDLINDAAMDLSRAEAGDRSVIRLVEGRVLSRRSRGFRDEVVLDSVRVVDAGEEVPRRLLIGLPRMERPRGAVVGVKGGGGSAPRFASKGELAQSTRWRGVRADSLIRPGNRLRLGGRISPLYAARNPGVPDYAMAWARRGVAARAALVDPSWVVALEPREGRTSQFLEDWVQRASRSRAVLKQRLGSRLAAVGDAHGIARTLALGDQANLSEETAAAFRTLGLGHLLAVSGLHVGLVAGLAGWACVRLVTVRIRGDRDPSRWAMSGGLLVAGSYAWLTGGSLSAQRAGWGLVGVVGLFALRRTVHPLVLLFGLGAGMTIVSPSRWFDVGARLSFAACLGLFLGGVWQGGSTLSDPSDSLRTPTAPGNDGVNVLRQFCGQSWRTSLAAGFGTAPVLVDSGMPLSIWAPLANLVAVPLTAFFVLPGSLLCAGLEAVAMLLERNREVFAMGPTEAMARGQAAFSGVLAVTEMTFFRLVNGLLGGAQWVSASLPLPPSLDSVPSWAVVLAVVGGFLCMRAPGFRGLSRWGPVACWIVVVAVGGPKAAGSVAKEVSHPRAWFFDVGQGDAALIQGRDASVLVDTGVGPPDGKGGRALVRSLKSLGVGRLDVLVITHADLDHRGGAERVLAEFGARELWLPAGSREDSGFASLIRLAQEQGTRVEMKHRARSVTSVGDLGLRVLWPPPFLGNGTPSTLVGSGAREDRNANSLVLTVEAVDSRMLLLADIDQRVEAELLDHFGTSSWEIDLVKVAHHGSRDGSRRDFLGAIGAEHAVVSGPCLRHRGLPNLGTLARLRAAGSRMWWTGRDGAVVASFRKTSGELDVRAWAEERDCER